MLVVGYVFRRRNAQRCELMNLFVGRWVEFTVNLFVGRWVDLTVNLFVGRWVDLTVNSVFLLSESTAFGNKTAKP